jgi:hypothetical protein
MCVLSETGTGGFNTENYQQSKSNTGRCLFHCLRMFMSLFTVHELKLASGAGLQKFAAE